MADPSRSSVFSNQRQQNEQLEKSIRIARSQMLDLEALIELAHDAVIVRDANGAVQFWNPGAHALYGWSNEEAEGKVTHILLETVFPVSKENQESALMSLGYWEGELIHRRKDGSRIVVASRQVLRCDELNNSISILEINRDITEERYKSAYVRLLQDVAVAANQARTIEPAVQVCLDRICAHTEWPVGHAYILRTEGGNQFEATTVWHLDDVERFARFREFTEANHLALEMGLPGRVAKSGKPEWISDVNEDPSFTRRIAARDAGLKTAFGLPVLVGTDTVAVLEFFSPGPMELDQPFLEVLASLGTQLGRVFERLRAERAQRRLSTRLLTSQDEERRRIARELHDSVGQYLSALTMNLEQLKQEGDALPAPAVQRLAQSLEITQKCIAETRTISYLLHPPLLEELGLASAAKWYVEGFASRSGINVLVEISPDLGRLGSDTELALFRILQECLTNIHRHSGSKTATVRIDTDSSQARLEVSDQGKGIPKPTFELGSGPNTRSGVGITGIQERVKDLGGVFEVVSDEKGTVVRAVIPSTSNRLERERLLAYDFPQK